VNAAAVTALVFFVGPGMDPSAATATQAAVKERLTRGGEVLIDLSAEHQKLFTKSPFVDFTAPPPAFLPPELAATWKKGSEACAQWTGTTGAALYPPQRAVAAAVATSCAQDLGEAIWPLFLQARHVKQVASVELHPHGGSNGVSTWLFGPDWNGRMIPALDVSADRVAATATKALEDLLAGGGTKVQMLHPAVPSVGVPGLEAVAFAPPAPARVPASCKGLPARLEVFPPGKPTRAIEAAYKTVPADKRAGPPLRCDLVLYPQYNPVLREVAVNARLACPPSQAHADARPAEAATLIAPLVEQTVAALCWAQGTQ
jgi:hypothetical protein